MDESTRNVLREAKELVNRRWFKGYVGVDGASPGEFTYQEEGSGKSYCPLLALIDASHKYGVNFWIPLKLIEEEVGTPAIASWNNQPERTKQEVIDLFDRVLMKGSEPVKQQTTEREMAYA